MGLAVCLSQAASAPAGDRTNVPLKNWGGFAVNRDAIYDDLERLVAGGLAGRSVLNAKPLSRTEAARVVARAIETIRADTFGRYNDRRDLDAVLERLMEEFKTELVQLGVRNVGEGVRPPGFVSFVPVDRAQARFGVASHDLSWVANQGLRFQRGVNAGTTFESRAQIGDVLSFYLQPEGVLNEEYGAVRLASGYAKLTLANVDLLVGRESLWWGPGLRGSLILSNNAPPLDQIRIGTAEPFLLPWVGEHVGPVKALFFLAELEERREHPRARLGGLHGSVAPLPALELGISYVNMFGGSDRPRLSASDYPRVLFDPQASDQKRSDQRFRNNALFALDADLRLSGVDRYLPAPATRDIRLYGEFGWDDTCCSSSFIPLREAVSYLFGVHLLGVLGQEGLDARFEYTQSSALSFTHNQFSRGYWTRGEVISHVIGTDGQDISWRVTNRFWADVMVGLEIGRTVVGNTLSGAPEPQERRLRGALDVSYRLAQEYAIFVQYELQRVTNRDFMNRGNEYDHLLRFELTRSFR